MANRVQHLRSNNPDAAFPALAPGQIAINMANLRMAIGDNGGAARPIIAVTYFSTDAKYLIGDFVVNAGVFLRCIATTGPGAFDSSKWGGAAGGLSDAPADGQAYIRKNSSWAVVDPVSLGVTPEAPSDGLTYARSNMGWHPLEAADVHYTGGLSVADALAQVIAGLTAKIGEAPNDGIPYVRQSGAWLPQAPGVATITQSDTAPGAPFVGQLWYETDTGILWTRYATVWVETGIVGL